MNSSTASTSNGAQLRFAGFVCLPIEEPVPWSEPMWPALEPEEDDFTLEFTEQDNLDETLDSGFQSSGNSSRKTSESGSDWDSSFTPSEAFPSMAIDPTFNLWSPSLDDEDILAASPIISATTPAWEADGIEWGEFAEWEAMPSPAEAAVLLELKRNEEMAIHATAAAKKMVKKAMFFSKVFARHDRRILKCHIKRSKL